MDNWLIDAGNDVIRDYIQHGHVDQDMSQVKHIIEHRVATPKQYHLPPIQNPPQAPAPYQQPYPQHIIQQVPQPVVQNLVPDQRQGMFNKGDWMEMMMMQNHQMHQLVVQQMMLHSLPGGRMAQAPVTYMSEPTVVRSPVPPAVHHHHYQMSPPPQPAVHHYSALPPLEPRIVSPVRAATTLPGYYYYNDDGSNYYVYH